VKKRPASIHNAAGEQASAVATRKRRARTEVVDVSNEAPAVNGRFTALSEAKLRGGYYTPTRIATWLARWAIRTHRDRILEPSCGDGRILQAVVLRLLALGATQSAAAEAAQGVELIEEEAEVARARLRPLLGPRARSVIQTCDFFAWHPQTGKRRVTAVVGNPPFIRYQSFPEPSRSRAMKLMEDAGLKPNRLTNIWVPFLVAATEALDVGGRLAMVVPAELLQVSYAAQLRAFLTERFEHVGLIACNELFFDGAEQEVLLLLAEGALERRVPGNSCRVSLVQLGTVEDVLNSDPAALLAALEEKDVRGDSEKWLKYFLTSREIDFMREMRQHLRVAELSRFARVDVGVVTGKNEFFVLRKSEVSAHGLDRMTARLVSRSAHLRGTVVSVDDWMELAKRDERVHLVDIRQRDGAALGKAAAGYVKMGESRRVHEGYKCSIRNPWFHVPAMWIPDGFLFRQIHDYPRFIRNRAGATSTDTIHRFRTLGCEPDALVASTYTHLTAASAEVEGRSYGGGVLELEPTEAERLLVPDVLDAAVPLPEADRYLRQGALAALLKKNDELVLRGALGLTKKDCGLLRQVWEKLRDRRLARNKKRNKEDYTMPESSSSGSESTSAASSTSCGGRLRPRLRALVDPGVS
jgi:adenine-specific DNA-methyltransferase